MATKKTTTKKDTLEKVQAEVVIDLPTEKAEIVETRSTDLVTIEEQTGVTCARVDFNNPQSLVTFCDEIKDTVGQILVDTAQMSVNQEQAFISDEDLKLITSFDVSLEQSKREAARKEGLFATLLKNIKLSMGSESAKKEEEMKTYQGRFNEYCEKLNSVVEHIEVLGTNAMSDIQLRKDITEQMTPLVKQLAMMIEVGHEDKNAYDAETARIATEEQTEDTNAIVQYRNGLSTFFDSKLQKLDKVLVAYKEQIQSYTMQQNTDMIVVSEATSFIKDTAPILQSQGSTQVFNIVQGDRLQQLSTLNEAANLAMDANSKHLEDNIKLSVDLMVNGGITTDTLLLVQQRLQNGIGIIKEGKKQLAIKSQKDQETINKINGLLDQNQEEILQIVHDTSAAMATIETKNGYNQSTRFGGLTEATGDSSYRRKLTSSDNRRKK